MQHIRGYLNELQDLIDRLPVEQIDRVIEVLREARRQRKQIFTMGNGGSASTASHFVCDLAKNTRLENYPPFRVIGLSDNIPAMLAYANDEGYENVFSQQLASLVEPGDVVIAISASGNSPNVLKAVEVARKAGATTIGFTGFDGGKLAGMVDINLLVSSHSIEQVEDLHLVLEHMITKNLREQPGRANEPMQAAESLERSVTGLADTNGI